MAEVVSNEDIDRMFEDLDKSRERRKKQYSRYHIGGLEEIGERHTIKFLSGLHRIGEGETDLSDRVWNKEWDTYQALILLDDEFEKVYSMGREFVDDITGERRPSALLECWLNAWRENLTSIEELQGSVWETERVDRYNWEISLIEKLSSKPKSVKSKKSSKKSKPSVSSEKKELVEDIYNSLIEEGNITTDDDIRIVSTAVYMSEPSKFKNREEVEKILEKIL